MRTSMIREPLRFPAVRMSCCVADRLAEREALGAVVHSVFPRVANLRLDSGDFLSLSAPEVALAPNGVAVDLPRDLALNAIGLRPAQGATLTLVGLGIPQAHLTVTFAGAPRWEPRPCTCRLLPIELARRARAARAVAIAEGASGSLLPLLWALDGEGGAELRGLLLAARGPAALLCAAAAQCDEGSVSRAASRLAGLGPGLTPSGDDFLAGFAAAWTLSTEAISLPPGESARVSIALVAGASTGASDLGGAWLAHGVRGEVAEPMGRFFLALLAGEVGALAPSVRGVLALGATSGTDWTVGALLGVGAALTAASRRRS